MPRMRKRRYVSFVRRTKAVIAKAVSPSFLLVNRGGTGTSSGNKQWNYDGHIVMFNQLATNHISNVNDSDDISKLHLRVSLNAGTTMTPDKFVITGWTAMTTIQNTAAQGSGNVTQVDAYYWRALRDAPRDFTNGATYTVSLPLSSTFGGIWTASVDSLASSVPSGGSSMAVSDLGMTPFQGMVLSKYIRIYKKTRTLIEPGKQAIFEQRGSKDVYIDVERNRSAGLLGGKTEGIFFVYRGAPYFEGTAAPTSLAWSTSINYTYRMIQAATSFGGETAA